MKNPYLLKCCPRRIYEFYFLVLRVPTVRTPLPFLLLSLSFSSPSLSFIFLSFPFFPFLFLLAAPCFYEQLPHHIYSLLHVPCMLTHGMPCVTHMACHVSHTWLAMCHTHGLPCVTHMACHVSYMHRPLPCIVTHGLPCVTHMACHVSPTWLAMCRSTLVALKNMKF